MANDYLESLRKDLANAQKAYGQALKSAERLRNDDTHSGEVQSLKSRLAELRKEDSALYEAQRKDIQVWQRSLPGEEHLGPEYEYARMMADRMYGPKFSAIKNEIQRIENRLEKIDYDSASYKASKLQGEAKDLEKRISDFEFERKMALSSNINRANAQIERLERENPYTLDELRSTGKSYSDLAETYADIISEVIATVYQLDTSMFENSKRICEQKAREYRQRWLPMQAKLDEENRQKEEAARLAAEKQKARIKRIERVLWCFAIIYCVAAIGGVVHGFREFNEDAFDLVFVLVGATFALYWFMHGIITRAAREDDAGSASAALVVILQAVCIIPLTIFGRPHGIFAFVFTLAAFAIGFAVVALIATFIGRFIGKLFAPKIPPSEVFSKEQVAAGRRAKGLKVAGFFILLVLAALYAVVQYHVIVANADVFTWAGAGIMSQIWVRFGPLLGFSVMAGFVGRKFGATPIVSAILMIVAAFIVPEFAWSDHIVIYVAGIFAGFVALVFSAIGWGLAGPLLAGNSTGTHLAKLRPSGGFN